MINIDKAKEEFKNFLNNYSERNELGFQLKVNHIYNVVENAKLIANKLNLSEEDIKLTELIALLHDIARYEKLIVLKTFNSVNFNNASYGGKCYEDNLIRKIISDNSYDEIIKLVIENHNKLEIEEGLNDRFLLHCKIIRDADKLDNFRVKKE